MNPLTTNMDIREKIYEYDLHYYEVAQVMCMKPSNFSTKLKMSLKDWEKRKILEAIETAREKKEASNE